MTADKLPPLPYPIVQTGPLTRDIAVVDHFTAADLRAYALAAVEMARPKWTTKKPSKVGWYWTRVPGGRAKPFRVWQDGRGDWLVSDQFDDFTAMLVDRIPPQVEWSDSPLPEPLEPQP